MRVSRRLLSGLVVSDPFLHYQSLLTLSRIRGDDAQLRAVKELQKLYRRIDGYKPPFDISRKIKNVEKLLRKESGFVERVFGSSEQKSLVRQLSWDEEVLDIDSPQGLLLSGSVGTGKSMLIDMLLPMKKRWHYNAFMLSLFQRLNREKDDEFILLKIAYELIEESPVLAIDEFQLGDPASARIMKGVLIYYWKMGGVLVATSNRMPEDLYSGSFQAEQYKSFTELLRTRCIVHDMRSGRDFRREATDQLKHYHTGSIQDQLDTLLPSTEPSELQVFSRRLKVDRQDRDSSVAAFQFRELCELDLGPADYITIASTYGTIILEDVPILTMRKKNEARRFISLIDALYEAKCKLVIQAAALPKDLFFPDSGGLTAQADSIAAEAFSETFYDLTTPNRPNVSAYTTEERSLPAFSDKDFSKLTAFTGEDEMFAFRRAASRLHEMTSAQWWTSAQHFPNPLDERLWEKTIKLDLAAPSPQQSQRREAPKFGVEHFWAMVKRGGRRAPSNPEDWK